MVRNELTLLKKEMPGLYYMESFHTSIETPYFPLGSRKDGQFKFLQLRTFCALNSDKTENVNNSVTSAYTNGLGPAIIASGGTSKSKPIGKVSPHWTMRVVIIKYYQLITSAEAEVTK